MLARNIFRASAFGSCLNGMRFDYSNGLQHLLYYRGRRCHSGNSQVPWAVLTRRCQQKTCRFDCSRPVLVPRQCNARTSVGSPRGDHECRQARARPFHRRQFEPYAEQRHSGADNGTGFPRDVRSVQGLGLRIMQYRADTSSWYRQSVHNLFA